MRGAAGSRLSGRAPSRFRCASLAVIATLALIPAATAHASSPKPPALEARQWILIDTSDRARLLGHEVSTSNPMASTTKLMTAYLTLHKLPLEKKLTAPPYHPIAGESLLGLEAGERMSVRDLLYGLLLPSGNDAAVTLADGVSGSEGAFVTKMNHEARVLGLDDTSYANPIGLDAPTNYTSPRDLAKLTLALRHDALFRKIVNTARTTLETGDHPRTITNRNTLLLNHPWVDGVKTGYTPYGFSLYRREQAVRRGERVGSADVPNAGVRVPLVADKTVEAKVRNTQHVDVSLHAPTAVEAPIHRGQRIGTATVTVEGKQIGRVAAIAARPVEPAASGVVASVDDAIPGPRIVVWLLVVAAAAFVILIAAALVGRRSG